MNGSATSMQRYYAARAGEYDRVYEKPERQADLRQIEAFLPPMFAGRSVLEIACGTGYWTRFIARAAKAVFAFDASAETRRVAARRVDPANVRFDIGDAYAPHVSRLRSTVRSQASGSLTCRSTGSGTSCVAWKRRSSPVLASACSTIAMSMAAQPPFRRPTPMGIRIRSGTWKTVRLFAHSRTFLPNRICARSSRASPACP